MEKQGQVDRLSDSHLMMLTGESAINVDRITERGYQTITDASALAMLGFAPYQQRVPGLLIPILAPDGTIPLHQYRPDSPRQKENKSGKLEIVKYETPKGAGMRLDVPPICRPALADPAVPIWITEGVKKGDALACAGLCSVALLGVWNFKGRNDLGGTALLVDFDLIAWNGRAVRIVFDSDVMHKRPVQLAMERLTEIISRRGASVSAVYLPGGADRKVGVDDFLREHSCEELEALVGVSRPVQQPAAPAFELLDAAPPALRRPLQLVDGKSYVATWAHVQKTVTETLDDKTGSILKHDPPLKTVTRELLIVSDDGRIFGHGFPHSLSTLGFEIVLPEVPPENRLMKRRALLAYTRGQRVKPAEIFERVRSVFDRFIDFERSLADQHTMSEVVTCYTLATWFLDAFNVAGYVWPTGERGSGKTQLLTLIAELGYLGQVILASGTMATLRDMADYGAFLGFDDAENLTSAKQTDPDKRALLLAGNRRGNSVPVKEKTPDGNSWRTRYVQTFCFRGFTATRTPDPILGSRTITIPLVRTPDRFKANADPLNYKAWPCDRDELVDDLWMLALSNLSEVSQYDDEVGRRASLTGRNLEPWRAILSVALWLEKHGVERLFWRMDALSVAYQSERSELEGADLSRLVLRAVVRCILPDAETEVETEELRQAGREWRLTTKAITDAARQIVEGEDLDFDLDRVTSRVVGKALGRLRLETAQVGARSARGWRVSLTDLERLLSSFSLIRMPLSPHTSVMSETPDMTASALALDDVSDVSDITDISDEGETILPICSSNRLYEFNERAAIAEFDGGVSREEAEQMASREGAITAASSL